MGQIIINIFCVDIYFGINDALQTLASHSLGASENLKKKKLYRLEMKMISARYLNMAKMMNTTYLIFPSLGLFLFGE